MRKFLEVSFDFCEVWARKIAGFYTDFTRVAEEVELRVKKDGGPSIKINNNGA